MSIQGMKQLIPVELRVHVWNSNVSKPQISMACSANWQRALQESCAQVDRFSAEISASAARFRQPRNFAGVNSDNQNSCN